MRNHSKTGQGHFITGIRQHSKSKPFSNQTCKNVKKTCSNLSNTRLVRNLCRDCILLKRKKETEQQFYCTNYFIRSLTKTLVVK